MEKNNLEIFNLEILKNDLKKDLLFYNMENNLEILKNSENNNLSINTMDNIIEIFKRKINRKINENVKHKASLKAFDDYIKNLGDDKTKLKQFNVQLDNLNKKTNTLKALFTSFTSEKRSKKIKSTMEKEKFIQLNKFDHFFYLF